MEKDAKIYVAGHKGMVGSAICRALQRNGYTNIITRSHKELDLCRQDAVEEFFSREKPDYVFLAAAKVGGIMANSEALADFMYENMILEMNVIHAAWQNNCKKLMFLGSSCIYPRMAPQPYYIPLRSLPFPPQTLPPCFLPHRIPQEMHRITRHKVCKKRFLFCQSFYSPLSMASSGLSTICSLKLVKSAVPPVSFVEKYVMAKRYPMKCSSEYTIESGSPNSFHCPSLFL